MVDRSSPGRETVDADLDQTDWSMIHQAAHGEPEPAAEAWDVLARRYWPAAYAYVRRSGYDVHEAADLTQGFISDVVVGRGLLLAASPQRGRFRTLLLTALRNYLAERHRFATRRRRSPPEDRRHIPLAAEGLADPAPTPEAAFVVQWSVTLIRRVLDEVQAQCLAEGLAPHWTVFETRVVRPMLEGQPPLPYPTLVERLSLKDAAQAANMMITVKRRLARALLREVAKTVHDTADAEDEIRTLLRSLEGA